MADPKPWTTLPKIGPNTKVEKTYSGGYWVNGRPINREVLMNLPREKRLSYERQLDAAAERTKGTEVKIEAVAKQSGEAPEEVRQDINTLEGAGFTVDPQETNLINLLKSSGIDVDNPELKLLLDQMGGEIAQEFIPVLIPQFQQKYPSAPATAYSQAFAQSGFDQPYAPDPLDFQGPLATAVREGGVKPTPQAKLPGFETQDSTGWLQFQNGVLVDPSGASGAYVHYDPTKVVPGSPRWFREVVSKWDDKKVAEWRKRLHEFGYLDKDEAKEKGIDGSFTTGQGFMGALYRYHEARYLNGGKPTMGDASIAKGSRTERAKLVNVREEMGAQIRNTVRSTYRNIYGTDPSDGEVEAFSSSIFDTAMELQRRFRSKYGDPNTSAAVQEASERQIERIENSPQASFLRESEEENTRLRDSLQTAVMATRGLA